MKIGNDWDDIVGQELNCEKMKELAAFVEGEYERGSVYPPRDCVFNALKYTPYSQVKVVILGQDPYHGRGQAHGLAFSVMPGVNPPPSLVNIYKELEDELGIKPSKSGYLESWAKQGVLLLNTVLTVREGEANSHKGKGWEDFTDQIIRALDRREKPMVFMLWGANAGAKAQLISNENHLVLRAPHPSPLSSYRGFFGCGHFKAARDFLQKNGEDIDFTVK